MPISTGDSSPILTSADLAPFAAIEASKAEAMVADALAMAARVAPCILDASFEHREAARAILRGAVLRWNEAGSGALSQQAAGPFSQTIDTRQNRGYQFWPSEERQLKELCRGQVQSGAFSISPAASTSGTHAPWCDLMFNGASCSCGANLTGGEYPLYGV